MDLSGELGKLIELLQSGQTAAVLSIVVTFAVRFLRSGVLKPVWDLLPVYVRPFIPMITGLIASVLEKVFVGDTGVGEMMINGVAAGYMSYANHELIVKRVERMFRG